jgi:enoyl-CoA hydratase/carnithine racemase
MSSSSPVAALASRPPMSSSFLLSFPEEGILVVTINRAKAMNSIPTQAHWEAHELFQWFDKEPSLRVAIITGAGDKAFCAGQDLIELNNRRSMGSSQAQFLSHPPTGFAGISRRVGKKPVIAAVNGFALGGGFEICLNWYVVLTKERRRPFTEILQRFGGGISNSLIWIA